jgi:hypothetical protein
MILPSKQRASGDKQMTHPVYLVEHAGLRARYFIETDRDTNSLKSIVDQIRSGELKPVKIIEMDEDAGTIENITEEVMGLAGIAAEAPLSPADLQAAAFDRAQALRNEAR